MAVSARSHTDRLAELRARKVFDLLGVAPDHPIERLSSVTNEVWASGDLIVRVSRRVDGRLPAEAKMARHLPAAVGYPEIVDWGRADETEWMATRRRPGQPLSRAWPHLTDEQRTTAIGELAERLQVLHTCDVPAPATRPAPQLVDFTAARPLTPVREALNRVAASEHVPGALVDMVTEQLDEAEPVLAPPQPAMVVHGDLTFENVLHHDGHVVALLDFEWARRAPADLDLDVLLRFVYYPKLHVAADYVATTSEAQYRLVPRALEAAYPRLFETPDLRTRLVAYSIGFDLRELLAHPPDRPPELLHPNHPLNRLRLTASRQGHLHHLTGTVGR